MAGVLKINEKYKDSNKEEPNLNKSLPEFPKYSGPLFVCVHIRKYGGRIAQLVQRSTVQADALLTRIRFPGVAWDFSTDADSTPWCSMGFFYGRGFDSLV